MCVLFFVIVYFRMSMNLLKDADHGRVGLHRGFCGDFGQTWISWWAKLYNIFRTCVGVCVCVLMWSICVLLVSPSLFDLSVSGSGNLDRSRRKAAGPATLCRSGFPNPGRSPSSGKCGPGSAPADTASCAGPCWRALCGERIWFEQIWKQTSSSWKSGINTHNIAPLPGYGEQMLLVWIPLSTVFNSCFMVDLLVAHSSIQTPHSLLLGESVVYVSWPLHLLPVEQQQLLVVLQQVMILRREGPELLDANHQQVVVWMLGVRLSQQALHPKKKS